MKNKTPKDTQIKLNKAIVRSIRSSGWKIWTLKGNITRRTKIAEKHFLKSAAGVILCGQKQRKAIREKLEFNTCSNYTNKYVNILQKLKKVISQREFWIMVHEEKAMKFYERWISRRKFLWRQNMPLDLIHKPDDYKVTC